MASILVCIIFILRPVIKKTFGINVVYFMWLLVVIKLIIPYGPESKISIYNVFNKVEDSHSYDDKVIINNSKINLNTNTINNSIENLSEIQSNIIELPIQNNKSINQYLNIKIILLTIWGGGILIFISLAVISYYKLFNIRKDRICKYNRQSFKILENCLKLLNIRRNIEILVVRNISSPALCGAIRPKILIPQNIFNNVSNEELKYIILHELCHYKRKDVQLTLIIYLLKALYWFNPIIYFALNTMQEDSEIACDNMVVSKLDKKESLKYGYTIINVLSYIEDSKNILGATSMISNKKRLKERIKMIGENKKVSISKIIVGVAVVIILGVITLSSGVNKVEAKANSNIEDIVSNNKISAEENVNSNVQKGKNVILDATLIEDNDSQLKVNSSINIVIYNSHVDEEYKGGYSVIDAGISLNNKLNELNVNSTFLKCERPELYTESYKNSENTIKENIENYSDAVLVDVHRLDSRQGTEDKEDIIIDLSKSSVNYEENLRFAEIVSKELENRGVKVKIVAYNEGINYFNLHLSKKSLFINVGYEDMTEAEVDELMSKVSESIIAAVQ